MLLLFFWNQQGASSTTTIDTGTYSQHPVNCIMAGNVPLKAIPTQNLPPSWLK